MWRSGSRSRRSSAFALLVALLAGSAHAGDWSPVFVEDGVTVRERPAAGRALPDFQGEVEVGADAYQVLAVVLDVPGQTAWMWQCQESRVLARDGDEQIVYHHLKARWPATDRDVVFRVVARVVEPDRRLSVRFLSEANTAAPPTSSLVRMPSLDAEFDLVALTPTRTRVSYTVAADPGGMLPASFLSETVRQSPFDTLVGLRQRVAETRGLYDDVASRWRARR